MKNRQKKLYIEFIRICACFCVIFTHTMERGYFLFASYPENSVQYWLYMMFSVFCKAAVPMFFAISGALLISKEESLKDLYKNRVLKMVFILVFFSFLYYLRSILDNIGSFSLGYFIKDLLISNWNFTFWYLYAFILFLISLPFLRVLVKNMKMEHFYYLFAIVLIFKAVLPITEYLLWQGSEHFNSNIRSIWLATDIFVYPILGYFIEHKIDNEKSKQWILPLWVINVTAILVSCLMTYYQIRVTGVCEENKSQTFFSCFTLVNVATIYISIRYWFSKRKLSALSEKIINSLGSATFGIYLVHLLFLNLFPVVPRLWPVLERMLGTYSMLSAIIICVVVMGMSYMATFIMKKLPVLKRFI